MLSLYCLFLRAALTLVGATLAGPTKSLFIPGSNSTYPPPSRRRFVGGICSRMTDAAAWMGL
jgi:hypothetical protein